MIVVSPRWVKVVLTTLIRRVLKARTLCGEPTPGNRTVARCLAEAMVAHAIRGNAACIE
jgi:hypothetical protein